MTEIFHYANLITADKAANLEAKVFIFDDYQIQVQFLH